MKALLAALTFTLTLSCASFITSTAQASPAIPPSIPAASQADLLPHGSSAQIHKGGKGCPAGMRLVAPRTTDPASSAPQDLASPELSLGAQIAQGQAFQRFVGNHKVHWVTNTTCTVVKHPESSPVIASSSSTGSPSATSISPGSFNWSGYVADGQQFVGADMEFYVPDPVWVGDLSEAQSVWPGIGSGASMSDELVQAGWEQDQRYWAGVTSRHDSAWYQVAPQTDQIDLDDVIAQAGETVWAHVDYDPATKTANFMVCNVDRDFTCANATQDVEGGVGDQAEWIVERTELCSAFSCSYPSLPETTNIVGIYYPTAYVPYGEGSIGYNAVSFAPTAVTMYDCSGTLLAWPDGLDDVSFYVQKAALGNSDPVDCKG